MLYILILIFSAIAGYFGPWWAFAPVCIALCYWKAKSAKQAALISLAAVSTLWIGYSIYLQFGDVDLVQKMAGILTSKAEGLGKVQNNLLIYTVITFIASSIASLAGLTGYNLSKLLRK